MNKEVFFFNEKGGFIQKTNGKLVPLVIEKTSFTEIVREIINERKDFSDPNIICCKAITKYTGGCKITKRTKTYYSPEWMKRRELVMEEVKNIHQTT